MKKIKKHTKNTTLSDFLDLWIKEELMTSSHSSNTLSTYLVIVKKIQNSSIGQLLLRKITAEHLQAFMDEISFGEKAYAKSTCNCYMSVLNKVFRFAMVGKQFITTNPMEFVINKKRAHAFSITQCDPSSVNTITSQQFKSICAYLHERHSSSLLPIQIGYYTGLRLGEVCGLTWDDIDLENEYMIVRRTVYYNTNLHCMEIGPTKSGKTRIVDFGHTLSDILKNARAIQNELDYTSSAHCYQNYYKKICETNRNRYELHRFRRNEKIPSSMHKMNFVCHLSNGSYLMPRTIQNMCISVRQSLSGLEHFHFHSLRHTYTSNLLNQGAAPQDVQELLGHADVRTTMNIYAHSLRSSRRESVHLLDQI